MDVSIIMPCYNSQDYILEGVESVLAYQGKCKVELIIIDDGSTNDKCKEILSLLEKRDRVQVIYQSNQGAPSARNKGVLKSKGRYLLFLDSDNIIYTKYIDKAYQIFEHNSQLGVVYAKPTFFGDNSRSVFNTGTFSIDRLLLSNYIDTCAMVRREAFMQVGMFDTSDQMFKYQDWELWLNIYKNGWKFYFLNEKLYKYRVRKDSIGGKNVSYEDFLKIRKYIRHKHFELINERIEFYAGLLKKKKLDRLLNFFFTIRSGKIKI